MFCPKCATKLEKHSIVCHNCSISITQDIKTYDLVGALLGYIICPLSLIAFGSIFFYSKTSSKLQIFLAIIFILFAISGILLNTYLVFFYKKHGYGRSGFHIFVSLLALAGIDLLILHSWRNLMAFLFWFVIIIYIVGSIYTFIANKIIKNNTKILTISAIATIGFSLLIITLVFTWKGLLIASIFLLDFGLPPILANFLVKK